MTDEQIDMVERGLTAMEERLESGMTTGWKMVMQDVRTNIAAGVTTYDARFDAIIDALVERELLPESQAPLWRRA